VANALADELQGHAGSQQGRDVGESDVVEAYLRETRSAECCAKILENRSGWMAEPSSLVKIRLPDSW
jgi:hypothetical protein